MQKCSLDIPSIVLLIRTSTQQKYKSKVAFYGSSNMGLRENTVENKRIQEKST